MALEDGTYVTDERYAGQLRLRGVQDVVPFCYGTVAWYIGKKSAPDAHSHRWTVYLRGADGEDLTHVIQQVTFTLHPSFSKAVRTLTHPPYEVSETGWGEFEIGITIEFVPSACAAPVELLHGLKLYHEGDAPQPAPGAAAAAPDAGAAAAGGVPGAPGAPGAPGGAPGGAPPQQQQQGGGGGRKPVIRDRYDEVVFVNPPEPFHAMLRSHTRRDAPHTEVTACVTAHTDTEELWRIAAARRAVTQHAATLRAQLQQLA